MNRHLVWPGLLSGLMLAGWCWLEWDSTGRHGEQMPMMAEDEGGAGQRPPSSSSSPFAIRNDERAVQAGVERSQQVTPTERLENGGESATNAVEPVVAVIDVTQLSSAILRDGRFDDLVRQLRADSSLRQQLIDEFRQEQDPERRQLLMQLLGDAGGADVTLLASELIYSGEDDSRQLGLQMLQRARPGSEDVQQIASSLLATEIEPVTLVNTLTVLARPGNVRSENRDLLVDQVALMSGHADAAVRGISLDIVSRLSTDGRDTPVLLAGLQDSEPRVREAAAYALVNHERNDVTVTGPLWQMLQDDEESLATRRAALLALRSLSPEADQVETLASIERQMNILARERRIAR